MRSGAAGAVLALERGPVHYPRKLQGAVPGAERHCTPQDGTELRADGWVGVHKRHSGSAAGSRWVGEGKRLQGDSGSVVPQRFHCAASLAQSGFFSLGQMSKPPTIYHLPQQSHKAAVRRINRNLSSITQFQADRCRREGLSSTSGQISFYIQCPVENA
jgi:hypothetical protein